SARPIVPGNFSDGCSGSRALELPSVAGLVQTTRWDFAVVRPNSAFGRTTLAGQQVVCTSPGKLGSSSRLLPYQPSAAFPGTIGATLGIFAPGQPTDVKTSWFAQPGRFTAACATTPDGASYLKVDGAPIPTPVPNAGWGLHLGDVNLALGNLTTIVRKQVAAYAK
ncbi:MAG: hypothetical protein QOH62_578, partial [Solirubrobacteraceae bacterium]|nr:hypothetical protein [Solirubrobacteraceae bacterium]